MNVDIPLFKRSNSNVLNMAQFFHKQIMPHFLKVAWAIEKFRKKDRYRRTLLHFLKHKKPRNNRVGHPKNWQFAVLNIQQGPNVLFSNSASNIGSAKLIFYGP